ncbi:calcium-binding protein [Crocosphaera sp. Alani8]|uniref:calcium-binding protein n=1 Tax=Crocosphaera sp. Alani8 TaxID=3038952 RepID=UPI00313DB1A3
MAFIFGTPFDDFLFDTFFSDFVIAGAGNDSIFLGDDGVEDTVLGQQGDDTIFVLDKTGDNLIDGGSEINHDTVDYSSLNESITLKAQGIIEKASGGTDLLFDIESIVGAVGPGIVNTIDGSGSGSASLDVDLGANSLIVNGTGAPFPLSFKVFNFDNVQGTHNNDTIVGNNNDNVFFGSKGHDTYDGGAGGFDTVDYSNLGQQITLKAQGVVDKGSAGIDQLLGNPNPFTPSIDKIVGATGQRNLIDGRVSGPTPTTFNVDLADEDLFISGFGNFEVVNFRDVIGTANPDVIEGDDTTGLSNILFGQQGNDFIRGVNENGIAPGLKELDVLVGGSGIDTFEVGQFFSQDYYLSNSTIADPFGNDDFAFIFDFTLGVDRINISLTNPYVFNFFGSGVDIYADTGLFSSALDNQDDLITRIFFNSPLDLPVPPSSPKFSTAQQSTVVADELTNVVPETVELAPVELSLVPDPITNVERAISEILPEGRSKITTVDQVIEITKDINAKLDEFTGKNQFGSVFTQKELPNELSNIFAPVDFVSMDLDVAIA